jgi:alpha-1,2-mannosyltransferase
VTTRVEKLDPRWLVLASVGAGAFVSLGAWALGLFDGMIDLRVYRMGGTVLLDGASLYDAQLPGSGLPFTYPPFSAVTMVPLAAVPWSVALVVWTTVSLICLAAIWHTTLPATVWSRLRSRWLLALAAVTVLSLLLEPVWQTVQFGQINLLLTAMILLDLVGDDRRRWRGVWVGVAIGVKLTPLPFLGLLLVTRQWRALRNAVLGLLATIAIGFAIVPNQSWEYWTKVVRNAERVGGLAYAANQSLTGFLVRIGGESSSLTWFLLSATFGLAVLWLARRMWLADERVAAVSVCALAVLYASPVTWSHHWIWAIPLGVSLIRAVGHWGRRPARIAPMVATGVAWFGLFALGPIWWVPYRDDRELDWTFWQSLPGNAYLIAGLVAFAVLAVTSRTLVTPQDPRPQPANSSSSPPTV